MSLLKADDIIVLNGGTTLLRPVSLQLEPGEPLVVLGETGSGKSILAQALMGTLPPELAAKGRVAVGDRVLSAARPEDFRGLWGRDLAVLPQEPWLSLDPLMRSRAQVSEAHRFVRGLSRNDARTRAESDLAELGLAEAGRSYPHQLSGGMAQRVAIAAARAGGARIVIADEPTKGLDAARRDDVADLLLGELRREGGLLVITHDLALARRIGGSLIVLRAGEVVESGSTAAVFSNPKAEYTHELLAADPENWTPRPRRSEGPAVVSADALTVERGGKVLFRDVSLGVGAGRIFGVTGPSGCGKSSLGDALLGLVAPASGRIERAEGLPATAFQKLYQDPVAAFPRKRILGQALDDVARLHGVADDRGAMMERLNLEPALLSRRPEAVSGGELQRIALLRLLLLKPKFIFADEPTSRLDPITQAQVIRLVAETAERDGCAIMLVSHDAALIRNTADGVLSLSGEPGGKDQAPRNVASVLH